MLLSKMNLNDLATIFGSQTKAQEIFFLLHDVKDVVRQGFYDEELLLVEQFCREQHLFLVKSKFKVLLADDSDYSNKGLRIPLEDSRKGMFFVYLSKNEEKALLASYYELVNNDTELGKLLGYPNCCIKFFCQHFGKDNPNLELLPTNLYTNLSQRHQDAVLLSHFPCRSDCPASITLAQQYLMVLQEAEPGRADELLKLL